MTRVICRTMRRRECKLFISSVTFRISPNQWIILLTMLIFKKASLNLMYHTAVTTPGTLRLLLARTTPGPQRSRAESRRLLLARDYSWPVTPVKIRGEEPQRVHQFTYLGSSVENTGGMATEITQRVSAAWINWKKCSEVLCDRRMPVKLKGNLCKTVVRPALSYGAEIWATTKWQEARLDVK